MTNEHWLMVSEAKRDVYEVLVGMLGREVDALQDGRLLFEMFLWRNKRVDVVPGRPVAWCEDSQDLQYDPLHYEIGVLEGLAEHCREGSVNDDDLDAIRDVMVHAYDDLEMYVETDDYALLVCAYEKALIGLEKCHVIFDEPTGCISKTMDEVIDSMYETGDWSRNWRQVGTQIIEECLLADFILDENANDPREVVEERTLRERLQRVVSTLTRTEQIVIDFRFGLTDGYSRTLEEVGKLFGITREDVCRIELLALRKLRHPSRMRSIGDYRTS